MVQHAQRDCVEAEAIVTQLERARRVEILKQLRAHTDEVDANSSEKLNAKSGWLEGQLERANATMRRVIAGTPDAATASKVSVVDALLFHRLSVLSNRQSHLHHRLERFTPASFVDALTVAIKRHTPHGLSLRCVPHASYRKFKTAPGLDFMLGVADAAPGADAKKTARRPATAVVKGANVVQPTEVKQGAGKVSQMKLHIANMRAALQRLKRCELWSFLLDPACFHRSCDNIWYLVNLIKDKEARLDVRAKPPVVHLRQPGEAVTGETPFFFDFNYDVYRMLLKRYNIRDCAFPPLEDRAPHALPNGV